MKTALYRHFDSRGALLYVGISLNSIQRTMQHKHGAHWFQRIARITIEWLPTRQDAERAERDAIRAERPAHNIVHSGSFVTVAAPQQLSLMRHRVDEWAKNEVQCTGEELGRTLWRGVEWAVTEHGVEKRDGCYFICRSRLYQGMSGPNPWPWERHMAAKSWVNSQDFDDCMRIARTIFPRGTKPAEMSSRHPDLVSHFWVGQYLHTLKNGALEWQGQVLAVDGSHVRVQLFSWLNGEQTEQRTLALGFVASTSCRLYETREQWLAAADAEAEA